jgi:hypothetical protein
MSASISTKITAVLLLFSLTCSLTAADKKKKEELKNIPLYQGVTIGFDLGKPVQGLLSASNGIAIKADVNLKNAYFPTIEIGQFNYDKTAESGLNCISSGPYFKIGLNKALSYNGNKAENMFYVGGHYGLSVFKYSLSNLVWHDTYWVNSITSFTNQKAVGGWIELVAGVRVKVWGPISLGWSGQYKSMLHLSKGSSSTPAYIPGYGEYQKPMTGINFHLYYRLPF